MYTFAVAVAVMALLVAAQIQDDDPYHPHAAFAFIRTGERTPSIRPGSPTLTALGAQQMFSLGHNFRSRYLISDGSSSSFGIQNIDGLSPFVLNNDQVLVQTLDAPHLISSATAFMQGLYPPHPILSNGTGLSSGSVLSNGNTIDFPLNGYQYANIQSSGQLDYESIFVSGAQNCPVAQQDAMMYFTTDNFYETKSATRDLYKDLNLDWFEGNLKDSQLDYTYALDISEYLQYQYAHNTSIYRTLANDSTFADVYTKVRTLADEEAWYLWGNTSSSDTDADNRAIAGKTLAAVILGQFQLFVLDQLSVGDKTDMSYPLTLLFGEYEPFISLISLMMADYHDDYFRSIPPFGSAMIFELFSTGANASFPSSQDNLWVRFYFHNGTDESYPSLPAYPVFGNGPSRTDMSWRDFSDQFSRIMVNDLSDWCGMCDSPSLFCQGVDGGNATSGLSSAHVKHYAVSPAVAGVIGAIVTLVVAALLFALAMLLGGIRFHRAQHSKKSDLGGFKGSRKLASDPDLSLAKNGAMPAGAGISFTPDKKGHERVGSWELRQKEFGRERRESLDGIDAVATRPVEPSDRV